MEGEGEFFQGHTARFFVAYGIKEGVFSDFFYAISYGQKELMGYFSILAKIPIATFFYIFFGTL